MSKFIERRMKKRTIRKNIVILYHANCTDGFGSAWAAWKKFGSRAEYIPVHHQDPVPQGLLGKEIYMLDFTYPEKITQALMRKNKRVTAIDHHISAKKVIKQTKDYSYAVSHSGSVLSWNYFHPQKPIPLLLRYIEDTDLWKFSLPNSKEVFAYLDLFDFNFLKWNALIATFKKANARKEWAKNGKLLLWRENKLIDRLVANNSEQVHFAGYTVYAVNSPIFQSQIGHVLAKKHPPFAIIWNQKNRAINVSLRSNGSVNVSKIAKRYGGGGHTAAAGFSFPLDKKFPWKSII